MLRNKWVKIAIGVFIALWLFNHPAQAGATVQKAWGVVGTGAERLGTFANSVFR